MNENDVEAQTKYWDDLDNMFGTDGWRQLILEIKSEIYQLQADALEANSWDEVNYLKGKASALAYVSNLQDVVKVQRAQRSLEDEQSVEVA